MNSAPVQLPSGAWRIRWNDLSGKRKSKTFSSFQEASMHLASRKEEVSLGINTSDFNKEDRAFLTELIEDLDVEIAVINKTKMSSINRLQCLRDKLIKIDSAIRRKR